jgi:hypothetical protein
VRHRRHRPARATAVVAVAIAVLMVAPSAPGAPAASAARVAFRIADARIGEASGIAAGLASPAIDYVQNDSGDVNRFFALNARSGATSAVVTVRGARNVDWEDIAVAPDRSGTPSAWLADIGDNAAARSEVQVYRVPEPRLDAAARDRAITSGPADVWRLRYPDGPTDAEGLAVAPDGTAFLVTKAPGISTVYRLPSRPSADRVQTLRRVGTIAFAPTGTANPFGLAGQLTATSAAIANDGSVFIVRTYSDAYVWRLAGTGLATALRRQPFRIPLPAQQQGEGVGVRGQTLLLDSEGTHSPVYEVPVPAAAVAATSSTPSVPGRRTTSRARGSASAPALPQRSGSDAGYVAVAAGGAAALALVGWLALRRRRR